ncbi:Hypothetical protein R9X50_00393800 [Acrodontium crateriforme]|uniref:FAD-binding PCMH-type domain-containing protein n=1 Tax=Acrodontium crateriforme TaxID=150365 RepID=A0AAQ3M6N8_9PEZI|nr:Hypothetical protein R9X50_00393800 [Acrodontium crateriforme]
MGHQLVSTPRPNAANIDELRKMFSGSNARVLNPGDDGYSNSILRWSRAAEKPAAVCVMPSSSEEVATAVKFATRHNFDLAVKGGGHSTAGASSTNGGVLIDLGGMRNVKIDVEKNTLYVQGGALWTDVDDAAWEHGLATVGGTVADTGVGGLSLGGGYGVLSGERGLVIDNIISATVVLASGDIKNASQDENEDLYWAILGAGQNFGVITEFVLQAFPQKELFMGTLLFAPTPENISKIVAIVNDFYQVKSTSEGVRGKSNGKTLNLMGFVKPPPLGGQTMIILTATYNGTEAEGRDFYKPLFDIGPAVNTMAMGPYPMVNKLIPTGPGMRSSMKGAAFVLPIRDEFVTDMLSMYESFTADCEDAAHSVVAWELFDPSFVVANENGCFANRGYHLNGLIMPIWTDANLDQKCRQWARDLSLRFKKELEAHCKDSGKGIEGSTSVRGKKGAVLLYGNYDQYDEIAKDIFGDHYPRLQKIKAMYDPNNVFNKLFAITPQA